MPTCSKTMSGASPRISLTRLANSRETLKRAVSSSARLAALAHHPRELAAVDVVDGAEALDQLALLGRGDDARRSWRPAAAQSCVANTPRPPAAPQIRTFCAGLQLAAGDQHAVGGEVHEAVGGRLLPAQRLRLGQQLLGLDLRELREGAPGRLIAPDLLRGRGHRVQPVDLRVLVGGLVAVHDDLVARLPAGDAGADLPHDAGGVGAADVVAELGVVAVAHDRHGLAERGPHVVVVDAGRHHAHDHLERARLGHLDLLELEGVLRFAVALLADDPGGHRLGQLARLGVYLRRLVGDRSPRALKPRRSGTGNGPQSYEECLRRRRAPAMAMPVKPTLVATNEQIAPAL